MRTMYLTDVPYWAKPPRDGQWARRKQLAINVISDGITRLPVLEGEVSHIEVPRISSYLGMTIVGGADTALRCIVVQEVYPEGLIGQDGRLRPGDQLVEINGTDITNTSHYQACQSLRKITPVLRLGVYREKVETCNTRSSGNYIEEIHTVHLDHSTGTSSLCVCDSLLDEPMLFIAEVMDERLLAHLQPYDRILSINGKDVDDMGAKVATQLIKGLEKVTLVISRKKLDTDESSRQKISEGEDKLLKQANTLQKWNAELHNKSRKEVNIIDNVEKGWSRTMLDEMDTNPEMQQVNVHLNRDKNSLADTKKSINIEDTKLQKRVVTINKSVNESLGMRIGGGVASSEGDIPIYIANIHPQGCVGRTQEILKGDILLNVGETSLIGLSHSQAVAVLKATVDLSEVTLTVFEGPETSLGSYNFIPSWLYWQHLPRNLQYPKTVIIHRTAKESLGFSIVGGEDPIRGPEPIHILYVVQDSPASIEGKLRSGDRLLAVDGHSLEGIKHSTAVSMLKRTGSKVTLQVVSWMGTEL